MCNSKPTPSLRSKAAQALVLQGKAALSMDVLSAKVCYFIKSHLITMLADALCISTALYCTSTVIFCLCLHWYQY